MGHYLVFTEVHSKDFSFNLLLIFQAALGAGKIHCLNFSKKLSSKMLCFFRNSFSDTHTKRVTTHSIHSFQQYLPLLVGSGHYFTLSLTSVYIVYYYFIRYYYCALELFTIINNYKHGKQTWVIGLRPGLVCRETVRTCQMTQHLCENNFIWQCFKAGAI